MSIVIGRSTCDGCGKYCLKPLCIVCMRKKYHIDNKEKHNTYSKKYYARKRIKLMINNKNEVL